MRFIDDIKYLKYLILILIRIVFFIICTICCSGLFILVRERMVYNISFLYSVCEECKKNKFETISSRLGEQEYENILNVDLECVICMNDMELEDIERLRCNHFFHKKCLSSWMEIKPTCPICRAKECCVRIIS